MVKIYIIELTKQILSQVRSCFEHCIIELRLFQNSLLVIMENALKVVFISRLVTVVKILNMFDSCMLINVNKKI